MSPSRRAFVVGGYRPSGGARMNYRIAELLHQEFALDVVIVTLQGERFGTGPFAHRAEFPSVTLEQVQGYLCPGDIYISSPVWDRNWIGTQHQGPKFSYVQSLSPWSVLDCQYSAYVSASSACQTLLRALWGIESEIIHPFVDSIELAEIIPWDARPRSRVIVNAKGDRAYCDRMLDYLSSAVVPRVPDIEFVPLRIFGEFIQHSDFLNALDGSRYMLTLSPSEGFGIVPLEAMARGLVVAGLDGIGGRDYMQPGVNCECYPARCIDRIAERFVHVLTEEGHSRRLSASAIDTVGRFSEAAFVERWRQLIARVI
jgi:hypothetical protein